MNLFWRIFLSFWLGAALTIAVVTAVGDILPLNDRVDRGPGFEPKATQSILTQTIDRYENQGPTALGRALQNLPNGHHKQLFLFDGMGHVLAGEGTPPPLYEYLATDALLHGKDRLQRYSGFRLLYVCPLQSKTGNRYVAVMTVFEPKNRLFRTRFWLNLTLAIFPTALVCLLLSLYITRPITRLRSTAQRLASGDLAARSSPHKIARRDELGALARDFDTMAAQIQRLMTVQRRFVADVSHELGAPLTRMHLGLALLRRQSADENNGALKRVEREADKLSNLVQQLLLLAGLEAGRCPTESMAPVSMRGLCDSIIEDANFEAEHANCSIAGSRQDVTLFAYPQLLRRAIDNVLRNAIHYAPSGSEVLLNCQAEISQLVIEVLDTGRGVPESMLADIFQPFFRTAPGRESESGGTGLGLAIAAEAVRFHGGTISAQNRSSGGLQVTIKLPLRKSAAEQGQLQIQAKI